MTLYVVANPTPSLCTCRLVYVILLKLSLMLINFKRMFILNAVNVVTKRYVIY